MAGTKVYIGRLSQRANDRDLEYFFRGYGKISEIIIKNGYGFIEFDDFRDADDAVHDLNGKDLLGERIRLEFAKGTPHGSDLYREENRRRTRDEEKTDYRIVVENLSSRASWQDLKDFMRKIGDVTYADAHSRRKGQGLIEFAHKADMKKALERLDGKELCGKRISLTEERKFKDTHRSSSRSRSRSGKRSRSRTPKRSRSKRSRTPKKRRHSSSSSRSRSRTPIKKKKSKKSPSLSPPPKKVLSDGEEVDNKSPKKEDGSPKKEDGSPKKEEPTPINGMEKEEDVKEEKEEEKAADEAENGTDASPAE